MVSVRLAVNGGLRGARLGASLYVADAEGQIVGNINNVHCRDVFAREGIRGV